MHRVHPLEVTEDRGDHLDMSSEDMKEYWELLRQLELTTEEESGDSFEDTS